MAGEDREYIRKVHWLPCAMAHTGNCDGRIEAHHAGDRGLSQRSHDRTAIAMCSSHHRVQFHGCSGDFAGWSKQRRIDWAREQIAKTQELVARLEDGMELFL